jgi:hypothetical protein
VEVQFTPEQQVQLTQIAARAATVPAELVTGAALRLLQEDARFHATVREGIAQAAAAADCSPSAIPASMISYKM